MKNKPQVNKWNRPFNMNDVTVISMIRDHVLVGYISRINVQMELAAILLAVG